MMIILFVGQIYQGLQALLLQNFKLFTRLALEFPAEVDFVKFEEKKLHFFANSQQNPDIS